jgi:MFS family permease
VVALVATFLIIPDIRFARRHGVDLIGIFLASVGLFLIVFGLIEGQGFAWGAMWRGVTVPEVIMLGVVALWAFGLWERTQTEPLVPLPLFRDRPFLMMNGVVAVMSFAMLGLTVLLPILLQSALRLTAFQAGLTVAPMSVALMIVAPWAGRLADGKAREYIPLAGLVFFAASLTLIVSLASPSASPLTFVAPMILGGFGIAFVMPPSTIIAMRSITPQMAGAASGVLNTTRQLGGVMGSAVVGALLQNRLAVGGSARAVSTAASLSPQLRQQFVEGFIAAMRPTLFVPIFVLALTVVGCLFIIRAGRRSAVYEHEHGALTPTLSNSES